MWGRSIFMKNRLLLLLALVALLTGTVWWLWRQQQADVVFAGDPRAVTLSHGLCLLFETAPQIMPEGSEDYQQYFDRYWIDSAGQFFVKTIETAAGERYYISVFNQADLQSALPKVEGRSGEVLARASERVEQWDCYYLLGRSDSTALLRLLIADPQFRTVTMLDRHSPDEALLRQAFEARTLTQKLHRCR